MKVTHNRASGIGFQRGSLRAVLTAVELQKCVQVQESKIPSSERPGRCLHRTQSNYLRRFAVQRIKHPVQINRAWEDGQLRRVVEQIK
jgi:hypothetical protein